MDAVLLVVLDGHQVHWGGALLQCFQVHVFAQVVFAVDGHVCGVWTLLGQECHLFSQET